MTNPTEQDQLDRDRMGDYVRRALPPEMERRGVPWRVQVGWGEPLIWATLTRGELEIRTWERKLRWWEPVRRERGDVLVDALANVLQRWHTTYRNVDETGRMHVPLWRTEAGHLLWEARRGAERVTGVLAPGVRPGVVAGGSTSLLYRIGEHRGLGVEEALREGWLRMEREETSQP